MSIDAHGGASFPAFAKKVVVRVGDLVLATVAMDPSPHMVGEPTVLSPFEARYLGDNGFPHPRDAMIATSSAPPPRLATDLHTHLAGAPRASDLVRIGVEQGLTYPRELLHLAEVQVPDRGEGDVLLSSLPKEILARLARSLRLPLDRQSTFTAMEQVYRLRSPITKHERAFVPMLWQIARDLASFGAGYVELSAGEMHRADRLRAAAAVVDEIEASTGVRLRFLVALSRHDDWEWDLDVFDRLEDLRAVRLIVGVDFMGHETTSTSAFARQLEHVSRWAAERRPGFVVRVHAGENPAHPSNVRLAVELAARPGVQLRIGHGVFGVDDATLDLMRSRDVIVEVNPSSNLAINNIQSTQELPLVRYLRAGIRCVIGTDGHGMYQTSPLLELRSALLSGASCDDLELVVKAEARYLALRDASDAKLPPSAAIPDDRPFVHFTREVVFRKARERRVREGALLERLGAIGVAVVDASASAMSAWIDGRRCVSIAGAWMNAWPAMPEADRARVGAVLDDLLGGLDPARVVLVTGGTRFGVEGEAHRRAKARGIEVLGVLVKDIDHGAIDASLAAVTILGETLPDKAARLYELMKRERGLCLFFGGGNVVHDEIQIADNLRLRYLLLDDVSGASGDKARQRPARAFHRAAQALARIDDEAFFRAAHEPFWHLGANPTVDAAIFRRALEASGRLEILLIRRSPDAAAEPDRWALIGGFVHTDAPRGAPFREGTEHPRDTLVREVLEEAGLDVARLRDELIHVGDIEGGGRDERDTLSAWSRTSLFAIVVDEEIASLPVIGGDDAVEARWWPVDGLPTPLAFDHLELIRQARRALAV